MQHTHALCCRRDEETDTSKSSDDFYFRGLVYIVDLKSFLNKLQYFPQSISCSQEVPTKFPSQEKLTAAHHLHLLKLDTSYNTVVSLPLLLLPQLSFILRTVLIHTWTQTKNRRFVTQFFFFSICPPTITS